MQNHAIPRPEYPRPQFVRDGWMNLNGVWEFEMDMGNSGLSRGVQNKEKLDTKKRGIKLTAWVQIVVGIVFIASVIILKQKNMFIFSFFALMLAGAGVHGLKVKYPRYDKQIWENIEKSWEGKGYDQCWFDNEHYFGIHFVTGDLILFNPDCNKERIKEIITSYRKKGLEEAEKEAAAESVTEEMIEDMQEEIAEEILG